MARTTAAQFARQLRRLGATVTIRDGHDVIARYHDVEVTAQFYATSTRSRSRGAAACHPTRLPRSTAWPASAASSAYRSSPSSCSAPRAGAPHARTSYGRAGPPPPSAARVFAARTPKVRCAT